MAQNGPKWSEMFRQMVQMSTGIPTPNCLTKNGEICQKIYHKIFFGQFPKKSMCHMACGGLPTGT